MTDIPILPGEEDDLLAAEYVTGLLDLSERSAVETRLRHDADFAARVAEWEIRLSALNDDYAPAPAPNLMPQIEARLFPQAPRRNWLGNLWVWGTTVAATLALVVYLALTPASPSLTATLTADGSALRYEAVVTQDRLTITRVAGSGAAMGRDHELWVIVGTAPPVSLGVLPDGSETITLPGLAPGHVLAISEEQDGGSPDGTPHGPIVALGTISPA